MGLHLPDAIRLHARERGTSAALTCAGSTVSYAELDTRSNRIARALLADADADAGSRIGFLARTRNEAGEILVGAAKAGLVNVPLNWRLATAELTDVARDAELRVLLVEPEFRAAADAVRAALPGLRLVVIGPSDDSEVPAYETWLAAHPDDDPGRGTAAEADAVFLQLYTSGTTGQPKGVQLTHEQLHARAKPSWSEMAGRPRPSR